MQSDKAENPIRTYDPLITRKAFAAELDVNLSTLWRWTKNGTVPQPVRIGGRIGWPQSILNQWKADQGWPVDAA